MSSVVFNDGKGLNRVGVILIILAALPLIALATFVIWPDFESEVVGRMMPGVEPIDTLQCPLILNGEEEKTISASFTNPTDEPLRLRIDSAISAGSLTRNQNDTREIFIPANETEEVIWSISAEDAVHDKMIIARFHAYRNSQMAARASNCGIMVLNIPLLSGRQIVMVLATSIVLLIGVGMQRILSERPFSQRGKRMLLQLGLLISAIVIPLVAGLFGLGLIALPLAVIPAVVLISLMEFALQ